jgi:signal transduction histidine kinase
MKRQETERQALMAAWEKKQAEWFTEHREAMENAEKALSMKLHETEAVIESQRQALDRERQRRQAELEERQAIMEKALRSNLTEKETVLEKKYQELLNRERAQFEEALAEAQRQAQDAGKRQDEMSVQQRQTMEQQFERMKATLQEEFRLKEKNLMSQWERKEKGLVGDYQEKLAEERRKTEADKRTMEQELERERQAWQKEQKEKDKGLLSRLAQVEKELKTKWQQQGATERQKLLEEEQALRERAQKLEAQAAEMRRHERDMRETLERELQAKATAGHGQDEVRELQDRLRGLEAELEKARAAITEADRRPSTAAAPAPASDQTLGDLIFGVAHQIRNPLAVIRSIAESLAQSGGRRQDRGSLETVMKAVDSLNDRLKDVVEFSKPIRPVLQPVALAQAIQRAASVEQPRLFKQGIELQVSIDDKCPALILDPNHLHTILTTLISNAVDAMAQGGQLLVQAEYHSNSQMLDLRVQDHGTGIRPEHLSEIGRPFFSTKTGAIGLGLATARRLLQAYGGDLQIESQVGRGTTVTCRFKVKPGEAAPWAA